MKKGGNSTNFFLILKLGKFYFSQNNGKESTVNRALGGSTNPS